MLKIVIEDQTLAAEAVKGGDTLRDLCREEVDAFENVMRRHPDYRDGLARFERFAVEGYLYQKIRGHLDATISTSNLPKERQDGEA